MPDHPVETTADRYTACDALLNALRESGVTHIFGNLGSDHAGIVQSMSRAKLEGRPMPRMILSPHEGMALAAAHGYAQVTGQAQAVFVHVDVGTQNMGGAISNALHGRVPVFIFAGLTPFTLEGELPGSRNRAATYLQDVPDQGGIVRQYVKWDYSIRTGKNVTQLVQRAMQIAHSDPKGPVYLTGAREVLEEDVSPQTLPAAQWRPVEAGALTEDHVAKIARALLEAQKPLLVTSYSGRNSACVGQLRRLCERLALRVVEERPIHMNFPADHPLHQGYQAGALIADADVIVILDCDVPWIPSSKQRPRPDARIFYIDVDPLKETIPLWYMPSERFLRADSAVALGQLNDCLDGMPPMEEARRLARLDDARDAHEKMRAEWKRKGLPEADGGVTPEMVAACLNSLLDSDAIIVNEAVTNAGAVFQHLPRTRPGTFFGSGGSSLGWAGGAALGIKLAAPERDVVCFTGDGSFFFINPSSVYWCARRYQAPFLTIVFNNQGWNATQQNFKRIHGAHSPMEIGDCVSLAPTADFAGIAQAAGGTLALTVETADELPGMLAQALRATRAGQCAVVEVRLPGI